MMISKTIRVHRQDSAFLYAILESLEGMASYSTLPNEQGDERAQAFRDISLSISPDYADDLEIVLAGLRKRMPIIEV